MKVSFLAAAFAVTLVACTTHEGQPRPDIGTTGRVATQRIKVPLQRWEIADLSVRFSELESSKWKVDRIRIHFRRGKPIVLSDPFIGGMWAPTPAIDAWTDNTRTGFTNVTLSTGDKIQRKLSYFRISDDRKVEELSP